MTGRLPDRAGRRYDAADCLAVAALMSVVHCHRACIVGRRAGTEPVQTYGNGVIVEFVIFQEDTQVAQQRPDSFGR